MTFFLTAFYVKKEIMTYASMINKSIWLSEKEASKVLKVDEQLLEFFRERGYLKPGSHWKSSNEPEQLPWKPKVIYFLSECKEFIDYWRENCSSFDQISA